MKQEIAGTEFVASPVVTQLVTKHQAQWIDSGNLDSWLQRQHGDYVMLLAGDPGRVPESLDVAVVLPELRRSSVAHGKSFEWAVASPVTEDALARKFGSQRWPALVFFRDGHYVTTVSGMHDWKEFVDLVMQALSSPLSRPPSVGIPVVRSDAGSSDCR